MHMHAVLLVSWLCMLWKRRLLKNKVKLVCTQMGYVLLFLVVILISTLLWLLTKYESDFPYSLAVSYALQTFFFMLFGVYILMSLSSQQRRVTTKAQVFATNRHTNRSDSTNKQLNPYCKR